ncbi:MAG: DNA transformation protein [Gammaproteobacteria bacterium]|jgi:DNA transformation protein
MSDLTTIRNIGPAQEKALIGVGISTAAQLRDLGADAAYTRLLKSGSRPHFIMYYVLHMALQGRPWNDCKDDEKQALRIRFDKIKAATFDVERSELETFLNRIGVVEVKP